MSYMGAGYSGYDVCRCPKCGRLMFNGRYEDLKMFEGVNKMSYMGVGYSGYDVRRCPKCGRLYVPLASAGGK